MRTAALLALVATAALAQVELLESGSSRGKYNHMNFTGCTVAGDAGWSTVDCSGGGGTASGWSTVFDCDLGAQTSAPLDAGNGNYSICGQTWVQFNSAQEALGSDLVNGDGLRISPTQTNDWYGTTVTAPGFYLQLTALVPTLTPTTRFRVSAKVDGNWSANYHGVHVGIWSVNGSTNDWISVNKGYSSGVGVGADYSTGQGSSTGTPGITGGFQILVIDYPEGLAGGRSVAYADFSDGGTTFPPSQGATIGSVTPVATQSWQTGGLYNARVMFVAKRAGAATTFRAVLQRLKIETYQDGSSGGNTVTDPDGGANKWHSLGTTGEPAFQSGWVDYDVSTYGDAGFRMESSGRVFLRGMIKSGTISGDCSQNMVTLPVGFRPPKTQNIVAISAGTVGTVGVNSNGNVCLNTGNSTWFSLTGVNFSTTP